MASTLTVDIFVSVDGWAGSAGLPGYFGYGGPELAEWIATETAAPHRILMGRKTYELLAGLPKVAQDDGWRLMTATEKVVFSTTLSQASWSNTRICSDDPADEVRRMKADDNGLELRTTGSLSVARQLIGAGLVDRLRLMVFPLVAGDAGREAFFEQVTSTDLELVDHRVLDGRVLLVEYRPTGNDIPRA